MSNGSIFKVPLTTIISVDPHGNADRLEIATVYGFQVVVQKNKYKAGDTVIYIPIDSILSPEVENKLFSSESKIKLHKSRVRQIRIRGLASQGMLANPSDLLEHGWVHNFKLEDDLSKYLNITKYEPPEPTFSMSSGLPKNRNKKQDHPLFHKYNGLDNIKWLPNLFKEGEEVVITEKLHGINSRCSILPYNTNTLWKKMLKFIKLAPKYEKCYGSNNVEISSRPSYSGFYGEDVYGSTFKSIDVFSRLKPGETIFGEIVGPGIQKNYDYGLKEHRFVLFDVKVLQENGKQKWLDPEEVEKFAKERGFDFVPVLYRGPFNKQKAYELTKGSSIFDPKTKVKEGIVIKARFDYDVEGNKKALKFINEDYLDNKTNTDFH